MASVSWTATTSGTWSVASNWNLAAGPLKGDDVSIPGGSGGSITVTYTAGSLEVDSLTTTTNAGFVMAGGVLNVVNGYSLTGPLAVSSGFLRLASGAYGDRIYANISQTGGTLSLVGGSYLYGSTFNQAGLLQITRGVVVDQETYTTLAGTAQGGGTLELNGTSATIAAGFVLATGATIVEAGTVYFNENLTYANNFTLANGGTLNLGNSTLTLTGLSSLAGTVSNSVLNLSGTGHLNGLTLENGTLLSLSGTYSQTGAIDLGQTGTGTLSIGSNGVLRVAANTAITNPYAGGSLINAGTLIKTGGAAPAGTEYIYAALYNTGTINASIGTIAFYGPSNGSTSTLAGTLTGAGTIAFDTGNFAITNSGINLNVARLLLANSASVTLTANALTYGGSFDQTGGTLVVGSPGQLGGSTLTLTGSDAIDGGLLKGTGTVLCSGAVNLDNYATLEGNLSFEFGTSTTAAATVSQTGTIYLGAELDAITQASIGLNETWALKGGASILGTNGTITNAGVFEKASGAGTSYVDNSFVNLSTGTLVANAGVLTLAGNNGLLGGTVTGSAALDITGNVAFAAGLSLSVGELVLDGGQILLGADLAYANGFSQSGGTLALGGHTLTLNGITSLESGAIQGTGEIIVNGPAVIGQGPVVGQALGLQQGAQLLLTGAAEQAGTLSLTGGSSAPTLTIASTYTLDANADIGLPTSSVVGTVIVASTGTLSAGGSGFSTITAAVVDSGAIRISSGDLSINGPLSGAGFTTISAGGALELNDNSVTSNAITFGAGGGLLSLGHPNDYTGIINGFTSGDTVELQGFAFAHITPVITAINAGGVASAVTFTETNGQSVTLDFSTTQTGSLLVLGEGAHGGLTITHL